MSRIRRNRGCCIDGTVLTSEKFPITKTGQQDFTHTVKNDCYLVVDVHANNGGNGVLENDSHVALKIGTRQIYSVPEPQDDHNTSDKLVFGLHVKAGATATLSCNIHAYESGSYVEFSEFKLS